MESYLESLGIELIKLAGEGGMARVYKARYKGKIVAVKVPKMDLAETIDKSTLNRFGKEKRIWGSLHHKNIVSLLDSPKPEILVMEFCESNLRNVISEGSLDLNSALNMALKILDALDFAHHYGIAHRDLKPENILICGGEPKITDWGIAKIMLDVSTKTGGFITPLYSAPEQIDPKNFGHSDWRTDIWQIGCLLYEMLSGMPPFKAEHPLQLISMIVNDEPSRIEDIPDQIWNIIQKCLAKRKNDRWQSIGEIKIKIQEFLSGEQVIPKPVSTRVVSTRAVEPKPKPPIKRVVSHEPKVMKYFNMLKKSTESFGKTSVATALSWWFIRTGNADAFQILRDFTENSDEYVRRDALIGLSYLFKGSGDRKIFGILKKGINDESKLVSTSAIRAIGILYESTASESAADYIYKVGTSDSDFVENAVVSLASIFAERPDATYFENNLYEKLKNSEHGWFRYGVGYILGSQYFKRGHEIFDKLKGLAEASDVWLRYGVAFGIGFAFQETNDENAIGILKKLVNDRDKYIRDRAAFSIGLVSMDSDSKKAKDIIFSKLSDSSLPIVDNGILSLGLISTGYGDLKIFEKLKPFLKSNDDWHIRYASCISLGLAFLGTENKKVKDELSKLRNDKDWRIKSASAFNIGALYWGSGDHGLSQIKSLLNDNDWSIRRGISSSLGLIYANMAESGLSAVSQFFDKNNADLSGGLLASLPFMYGTVKDDLNLFMLGFLNQWWYYFWQSVKLPGRLFF